MAKKSEINKKDLINLIEITDEEFALITDNLYSQKIDYKSLPNLVLLPAVKEELRNELNIRGNLYITKNRLLHTNPIRKNAHKNQGFTKDEYKSIPETIRNAIYALKETESEYNSFLITTLDKNDSSKVNCIIFDEDKNGNLLTTIKKVPLLSLRNRTYEIVGTGVEPAISNALREPSTTLTTSPNNENNTTKDEFVNNLAVDTTIINQDSSKSNTSENIAPQEIAERAQFVQNKLSEAGIEIITDKNEFDAIISEKADSKKMTQGSKIYGFSYQGKIYLNPEIATSETPLHEYTHLWDNYIQNTNPELWEKGKNILRNTKFWEEVKADPNYAEIAEDEDLLLSEVHAQISGKMADAILAKIQEQDGELTKNTVIDWNNETWAYIVQEFGLENLWNNETKETLENLKEFLSRPMKDLFENTEKVNIKSATDNNGNFDLKNDSILFQIIGEKGAAELDKTEEATTRLDNLKIAQKMTESGKDAKTIRLATGWECGADGNWRYEIDDSKVDFDSFAMIEFNKANPKLDELTQKLIKGENLTKKEQEEFNSLNDEYSKVYDKKNNSTEAQLFGKFFRLHEILDNAELYKAYPKLKDIIINFKPATADGTRGHYNPNDNEITLFVNSADEWKVQDNLKSTLLHEIQHAIQYIEGFAEGGSPQYFAPLMSVDELQQYKNVLLNNVEYNNKKAQEILDKINKDIDADNKLKEFYPKFKEGKTLDDWFAYLTAEQEKHPDYEEYKFAKERAQQAHNEAEELGKYRTKSGELITPEQAYLRLAGEVESRNVQTRINMTPEERRNTLLSETADVAQEDQIVMFDGNVAASKIISRSQYLEGKTELTDEDIVQILDLPHEKPSNRELPVFTDKAFLELKDNPEELNKLAARLKQEPEYLKYRSTYIAKSKLLFQESSVLYNEIPALMILDEINEPAYLLPYQYAKKGKDERTFADSIIENDNAFTDFKRVFSNDFSRDYRDGKAQGSEVFIFLNHKKYDKHVLFRELKGKVKLSESSDKTYKAYFYSEYKKELFGYSIDKEGFIKELDINQVKKSGLTPLGKPSVAEDISDKTHTPSTYININPAYNFVNDSYFNSLLERGAISEFTRNSRIKNRDERYFIALNNLEAVTKRLPDSHLKSSNLSFIQKEKNSQYYKDLIRQKERNLVQDTTKTKGEEKTMETENELSREEILDQGIEQIQVNGGMSEAAMEGDIPSESLDSFFFDDSKDNEDIMSEQEIAKAEEAYKEWEEMLDDNQKAEDIIEKNQAREPSESAQEIATNFVLEKLQQAGIEVITDESAMKSILEAGKEVQKMAAHYGTSQNIEGPDTFSGYGAYVVSLNKENAKELGLKIASKKYGNNFYIGNQSFPEFLNDRNFSQYWQTVLRQVSDNPTVEMLSNEIALTDIKGNASLEKEQAQLATLFNLNLISYKREQTYLYSVEIPDDNGTNYLHYDKSIGKENADRINSELKKLGTNWSVTRNDTGKNVYFNLLSEKIFHSQKLSSEFLQKIGFVGMETTNQNYIIFDDREMYINNRVQYMMTENGEVYGFAYNGKIYADKELMNSNVLAHEYTHLWDNYTRLTNPELWEHGKDIFKQTHLWEEIRNDPAYQNIRNNDDEILSECHARICGEIAQKVLERIAEKDGKSLRAEVIDWNQEVNRYISEELMINPELGNENYISDTIKQEFLQQFLSMPMKDLMNGVGYEKDTFIKEIQNSMYHTKDWSENFPKVYSHSLYYGDSVNDKNYSENVKTALLVGKAKRGDRDAAIDLVNQSVRPEIIKELHQKYPDAIVCAVDGLEASGHNMIPIAYQDFLETQGFSVNNTIIQSAKAHHTGADNLDKLLNRVRFNGEVQKGKDYILLDDHIAMGSTLRDLRDYIETNGGKVVAITTLTAPEQDYRISISKENFEKLSVYGEPLNEFLREYGITDNIKGLTDREATEIIGLLSDRGRNPETQEGIRRSACLHARQIQENYLKQQTQSQSLINPQKLVKQNSEEVVNLPSILSLAKTEHEELNLYGSSGGKLILDFKENPDAFCQLTGLDKEPYLLQSKGEPFTAEIHVRKNQEGKLLVDALIPDLNSTTLRLVNLENLLEKNGKEYSSELLSLLEERLMNRQEEKNQIQKMSIRNSPEWLKTPFGLPSKLSADEWYRAHSSDFKEKFGDWELEVKKRFLLSNDVVSSITGNEFLKDEKLSLQEQVAQYYKSSGNMIESPFFGPVTLDKKGADDSFAHGMSRIKAAAYACVGDVINKGVIIASDYNHKGRGYNSYALAAPIKIGELNYICEVVLKQNKEGTSFYLHEVTEQKKFLEEAFLTNLPQKAASQGTLQNILQNTLSVNQEIKCPLTKDMEPEKSFVQNYMEPQFFQEKEINHSEKNIKQEVYAQVPKDSLSTENNVHEDIEIKPLSGIFDSMMKTAIERGDLGTEKISENVEKKTASESEKKDKPKVDYIKKGAEDFLKAIQNGSAPFLDKSVNDFGKITIQAYEISNAQTGKAFSGYNQLLSQIYAKQQEMQSLIVTSLDGAKKAGTYIAKNEEAKKNYVLAYQKEQQMYHSRFFQPEAAENPIAIYSKYLEKNRPIKLKGLRECAVHYSRSPGDYAIANKYYQEIAAEHLKNIQAYISIPDGKQASIKDFESAKELLKNYFEYEKIPEREKTAFEETYGVLIDIEKERPRGDFKEKTIHAEMEKQMNFLKNNILTETELGERRKKEYEEAVDKMKASEKEQIDARGITSPESYLGRYLAACAHNCEFITDEKTIETVSSKLTENLKKNFQAENYEILNEIGAQASKISLDIVQKMSFDKAHSNDIKQAEKLDTDIKHPPLGMSGK